MNRFVPMVIAAALGGLAASAGAQGPGTPANTEVATSGAPAAGTPFGGPGRRTLGGSGSVSFEPRRAVTPTPAPSPSPTSSFRALADRFDRETDPR